ncbi:hypothetical protein J2S43_002172 [Catenuloplanes nepalensis]|uniref:Integral membrane protein n=1 Tax=Catenuloplanes nepalensis TaxID=587533 RepID=A0ABT9MQH2_9ACTN|nr:glycosyltransferase 87 family protein [Catenuloplanes nepalensis]MDP9793660.1 hypothetical protein [Catenuloplanes nepalensis]
MSSISLTASPDRAGVPADKPLPEPQDVESTAAGRSWWPALRTGTVISVASYVAWLVVTIYKQYDRKVGDPVSIADLLQAWWRFDQTKYTRIAESGYATDPVDPAFFPLYPFLIRVTDVISPGGPKTAGVVVAGIAMFAMYVLLYRFTEVEFGRDVAARTSWAMAIWPVAFYLGIGFNVSLFIALMIGTLYAIRRGHWWLAGALGGLASATRSAGLLLGLAFAYEYLRVYGFRWRWNVLAAGLMPSGLLAYMGYLWWRFDDPLRFSGVAMEPWGRELDWPWTGIVEAVQLIVTEPLVDWRTLHSIFDLAAVLLVIALLVLCFTGPWRMRQDQWVLPLLGTGLLLFAISFPAGPVTNEPLMSAPRYVMEVLAAFILLGRLRFSAFQVYTLISLPLQGVLLIHLLNNDWVV